MGKLFFYWNLEGFTLFDYLYRFESIERMGMTKKPLELNFEFDNALNILEKTDRNLFITGRAGTGKSTLLHLFRNTTRKKVVVLAPTGVAALNAGGQTIHSFFNFPAKFFTPQQIRKVNDRKLFRAMEVLIIDEISMVRADMLDNIDFFLRINREKPIPFGGVQLVFFGDLFQLPPVIANPEEKQYLQEEYDSPYFFSAKVLQRETSLEMLELKKVYRQEARNFIRLLDAVRLKTIDFDDLEEFNERFDPDFKDTNYYITLSARNAVVDTINEKELRIIPTEEFTYLAKVTGNFEPKQFPTESALRLKLGAQVMFIRNDVKKDFVNGTIGKVIALEPFKIVVQIVQSDDTKRDIEVEKATWEILRYKASSDETATVTANIETEVAGSFEQYPLKLAWAITIHKSQGKTFDRVIVDLQGGAFEHGQTYVALSRCRTLAGIVLKHKLRPQDVIVDERIIDFYESNV